MAMKPFSKKQVVLMYKMYKLYTAIKIDVKDNWSNSWIQNTKKIKSKNRKLKKKKFLK